MEEEQQKSVIIPGLPDEVSMLCLARLPYGLHSLLSCVSRSWRRALTLPALFDLRTRLGREEHLVFVSLKCTQFYLIDPRFSKCYALAPPPLLRAYPSGIHVDVLALGRQVYISRVPRGLSSDCPNDALCYDFVSRHWCTPPPPMLESRIWFASATVDGYVYAAGGGTGRDFWNLKSAERFDLASKKWEKIADMTEKRYMATGIAQKGSFCVLGGWHFTAEGLNIMYDSAEIWDALKEEWQLIPGMLPNHMWKVAIVKGKLYARHIKEVMLFDEKRKQWNPLGSLPEDLQQADAESEFIGVGDELWMLFKDINRKCTVIATDPESIPLCWWLLPLSFHNYPSSVCVVTL